MDIEASNQQRSRTRWTASLDKIFADLVVKQIQLGNRPNNIFDKRTWNSIRDEFNKQTDLNFNNNQLRKHLDVLRTRFYNLKSTYDQSNNDLTLDDSCCIAFDLWDDIGAQTRPETVKVKDCPIYEQLCTIFTDASCDGKYAQSSHYSELDKSAGAENGKLGSYPDIEAPHSEKSKTPEVNMPLSVERKRKHPNGTLATESSNGHAAKKDQEMCNAMAKAMFEMIAASKLRAGGAMAPPCDNKFTITNCIKALDEIQGVDDRTYFAALDLFEDPNLRETFLSLKSESLRLTWLQGKCGKLPFARLDSR